jgi:hypothetical protein
MCIGHVTVNSIRNEVSQGGFFVRRNAVGQSLRSSGYHELRYLDTFHASHVL